MDNIHTKSENEFKKYHRTKRKMVNAFLPQQIVPAFSFSTFLLQNPPCCKRMSPKLQCFQRMRLIKPESASSLCMRFHVKANKKSGMNNQLFEEY